MSLEFSFRTREKNLNRLKTEKFDFLIVGGGITGAATARDAALRGLKVALIEKSDFASGTSSNSSKLVHGGLRYLENYEFKLVFESLSERSWQLKDISHLVRPLRFFIPVYKGEKRGMSLISLGLWLYDLLSLFRTPGIHHRHSPKKLQEKLPGLEPKGLKGGFSYYDATMWDDLLVIENLRSAHQSGAVIASQIEAIAPIQTPVTGTGSAFQANAFQVSGFQVKDSLSGEGFSISAERVIVCGGPWTDRIGAMVLPSEWKPHLKPSRGIHLVFPRSRIPVEGAVLMLHPKDGRVSFVMPRDDFGNGVVIVGTTDGPAAKDPDHQPVPKEDEDYILDLLGIFFPGLKLTSSDVISRYIGIRPLVGGEAGSDVGGDNLARVSREHWIETFSNGVTFVAGGKYTTNRVMALEIVDHALASWDDGWRKGFLRRIPFYTFGRSKQPLLPDSEEKLATAPRDLSRFGGEAALVQKYQAEHPEIQFEDPAGFKYLKGQLLFSIRHEMTLTLEDFFFRRSPLFLARMDHGEPFIESLSQCLKAERGSTEGERVKWVSDLRAAIRLKSQVHSSMGLS